MLSIRPPLLSVFTINPSIYMTKAVMMVTKAQIDPVPTMRCAAPLLGAEVAAFAAPELALCAVVVVCEAAELAEEAEAEALALDMDIDMLLDADAEDEEVTDPDPPPVMDMAPSPVNVPSAIDLVVTAAVFESELLYHG
jgi:hypothetical protein